MGKKRKRDDQEETSGEGGGGGDKRQGKDKGKEAPEESHESPDAVRGAGAATPGPGVDKPLRLKLSKSGKNKTQRLIVVLERANLEVVKVGKGYELLNTDQHMKQIKIYRKDPAFCRPDITHQCLLMLFDSPLNRAGLLQVYIHTESNVLIEINPQTRFPRTFPRFAGLMVQLLRDFRIRSQDGPQKLLKVIKNPILSHLPVGCKKYGTTFQSPKLVQPQELVPQDETPVVVVIGAMAHGQVEVDYTEEVVSVSQYPLSAALACTKIVSAFEQGWGIH
jgi:rRNA small subunit pseudouridine methyltransferase Nep1